MIGPVRRISQKTVFMMVEPCDGTCVQGGMSRVAYRYMRSVLLCSWSWFTMWESKNWAWCSKVAAITWRGDRAKHTGPGDPLGLRRIVGHVAEEFGNLGGHDLEVITRLGIQVYCGWCAG